MVIDPSPVGTWVKQRAHTFSCKPQGGFPSALLMQIMKKKEFDV
jgi:hypothetical protein